MSSTCELQAQRSDDQFTLGLHMRSLRGMALAGARAWRLSGGGWNVTSVVVQFQADGAAGAAHGRVVLGFTKPGEDAEVPGIDGRTP